MPALTLFYGLRPEDIERMTRREISEYLVHLDRAEAEADAAKQVGR